MDDTTLWTLGDYDLHPLKWEDARSRAQAVSFFTTLLRERAWREGLTMAAEPEVSYTAPEDTDDEYYRRHGMGVLHLRAQVWPRLDAPSTVR